MLLEDLKKTDGIGWDKMQNLDDDRLNFKKKYDIIRDYTLYGNPTEKEIIGKPITTNIDGHRVTSDIIIV